MIGPGVVVGVEVEILIHVHLLSVDFNLPPSLMTLASRKAPLLTQLALFGCLDVLESNRNLRSPCGEGVHIADPEGGFVLCLVDGQGFKMVH